MVLGKSKCHGGREVVYEVMATICLVVRGSKNGRMIVIGDYVHNSLLRKSTKADLSFLGDGGLRQNLIG